MITEDDVRRQLHERLGLTALFPDRIWKFLVDRGRVGAYIGQEIKFEQLVDDTWAVLEVSGLYRKLFKPSPPMLPAKRRKHAADHQDVLAILIAREATADAGVDQFRREALRGNLLALSEVDAWVRLRATTDRAKTGGSTSWRLLACELPKQAPVAAQAWSGGVLEELLVLAERLAHQFSWSVMQATTFVLTGEVPALPLIKRQIEYSRRWPCCTRIILDIDPSATPELVEERYREIRLGLFTRRVRALKPKNLVLAAFAAQRPPDESWPSQMKTWNSQHAEWAYTRVNFFKRDCLQTQRRLLTLGEPTGSRSARSARPR